MRETGENDLSREGDTQAKRRLENEVMVRIIRGGGCPWDVGGSKFVELVGGGFELVWRLLVAYETRDVFCRR